jgi:general secretion pathway protein D
MKQIVVIAFACVFAFLVVGAHAADNEGLTLSMEKTEASAFPRERLGGLLDIVGKKSGRTFLVQAEVPSTVVVGQPRARDITYSMLLKILRNNGLAAVTDGDMTSIIPVAKIRQHALPLLFEDDDTIDSEEWVTRVIRLEKATATQMVPIMRPMLPQQGHLVANAQSNTVVIVDRYANVRRVVRIIAEIDSSSPARQD